VGVFLNRPRAGAWIETHGKIQPVDLQVKDPARLNELLIAGIGPAKAFGCGLLSLARA
jgi:CRISPR system Cascade subunit CasE